MIETLKNSSQFYDNSEDLVQELVILLAEVASVEIELTESSCDKLEVMIESALSMAKDLSMDYGTLVDIYNVVDVCASVKEREQEIIRGGNGRRRLVSTVSEVKEDQVSGSPFLRLINEYLDLVKTNMVVGQDSVSFIQKMSRSATIVNDAKEGAVVTIPLTDTEEATGIFATVVTMNASDADELAISVVQSLSRMYGNGSQFNTDPVQVKVSRIGRSSNSALGPVRLIMRNVQSPEYGVFNVSNHTIQTDCVDGDKSWYNYSCPLGGRVAHKCTGVEGRVRTQCPPTHVEPSCRLIIAGEDISSDLCTVVAVNSSTTTCECYFPDEIRRVRRLVDESAEDTVESSGGVEVVSMAVYSYGEFVETINESDNITAKDLKSAILVIAMFVVLWFFGVLALCDEVHLTVSKSAIKNRVIVRHRSTAKSLQTGLANAEDRKKYLLAYMQGIVPVVFTEAKSGWNALVGPLCGDI
jgi:hypothetical protein